MHKEAIMGANGTKKILIVDDENIVVDSCSRTFREQGFEVDTALSGLEGVRKASRGDFDLIITDYMMADINGIELVECVRRTNPHAPVIMITGYPTNDLEVRAAKNGVFEYLEKPFSPEEINRVAQRAIQWREQARAEDRQEVYGRLMEKIDLVTGGVGFSAPAAVCHAVTRTVSPGKARLPLVPLLILGLFAGIYIGFGAALATLVGHDAAAFMGVGVAKLLSGLVFSVGLILVVVAGAELFTGNNLMIAAIADRKITPGEMLGKWAIVYFANFAGSLLLVWIMYHSNLWKTANSAVGAQALSIANAKVNLTFSEAFFRGIGCNWLVCLAVWMALSARQISGKILAIVFPITAFVALGFEHCIANMYFIPMGILLKSAPFAAALGLDLSHLTWGAFITANLVPVTIGNIVGGAGFVGLLYWVVYLRKKNL
jgi:formate/nitrite transporter